MYDEQFRKMLEDFKSVKKGTLKKAVLLKKYGISDNTYIRYKKRYVLQYGVSPLDLYNKNAILQAPEILNFCLENGYITEKEVQEAEKQGKQVNREVKSAYSRNYTSSARTKLLPRCEAEMKYEEDKKEALDLSYIAKGYSTMYVDGNKKVEWVKEQLDDKAYFEGLKKAIVKLCDSVPPFEQVDLLSNYKTPSKDNLSVVIPIADLHLGLSIDPKSTSHGIKWNREIAKKSFYESMEYIINASPQAEECVLIDCGDILHQADNKNQTPKSGHHLDVDGSYEDTMLDLFELMINTIYNCLKKFPKVYFHSTPGNHNDTISLILKCILKQHFRNNPRVVIDIDKYNNIYYHSFGKNLIAISHGDEVKPHNIESFIVSDNLHRISEFKNFVAFLGHYHQEKEMVRGIVQVKYVKNAPPADKWADSLFRSASGLNPGNIKAFVFHDTQGIISTLTYNPVL